MNKKKITNNKIPNNYKILFAFAGSICKCHKKHLTYARVLEHNNMNENQFHDKLFGAKLKKYSNIQRRREN